MGWFNNIFDSSKKFDDTVNALRQQVRKVNETNESLIERIGMKDTDIVKAGKSIERIIQIWKNINSSESLSKILTTIVNGLSSDLDFLYCLLFQIYNDKETGGTKVRVSIASNVPYFNMEDILANRLKKFGIPYGCNDNDIIRAIKSQKVQSIDNFQDIFKGSDIILEKSQLDRIESIFIDRAITALPLMVQGSPFGCLVAVSVKKNPSTMDNNYLKLFAGQIELSVSMTKLLENVKSEAITDVLTGLYNRRFFNEALSKEVKKALRTKRPFTLVTLDLDHLKQINDSLGHSAGDAAIAYIGEVLLKSARETDIPSRFGGEEFAIIMPETDIEGGMIAAQRIRSIIISKSVEGVGVITASIGVATFFKHAVNIQGLVDAADNAMYLAKKNGRNRVELAQSNIETENQTEAL